MTIVTLLLLGGQRTAWHMEESVGLLEVGAGDVEPGEGLGILKMVFRLSTFNLPFCNTRR